MSDTDTTVEEDPTIMGLIAGRLRMTEGQLYTAVIAVAIALLLTLTGLPTAHERVDTDGFGGDSVPTLPSPSEAP